MIAAAALTKRYGPIVAVDQVSFEIGRGEVVGLLGANGAGKTTIMRMLTGTLQPDGGSVTLDGRSIGDDLVAVKRRIGYLPESNPLYLDMQVFEYLGYAAELRDLRGAERQRAITEAVESTDIGEVYYRPVAELSKGFRQRVGLAAAILHRPEVLVLDEPTEGLDPNQRIEIRKLIHDLGRERTVLVSTHVLQEVEATCDRLIIVAQGRVVADGTVAALLAGSRDTGSGATYVVEIEGDDVESPLAAIEGVTSHSAAESDGRTRIRLTVAGDAELRPIISRLAQARGWTLWELYRERTTLEQVFSSLTVSAPPPESDGQ
jgi:ABC-2 type transport system ATP-binding protein